MKRDPRQTGRTTRIAQFAVDQLMSCGRCIVTDHILIQGIFPPSPQMLDHLIKKVVDLFSFQTRHLRDLGLTHEIVPLNGTYVVDFKMVKVDGPADLLDYNDLPF